MKDTLYKLFEHQYLGKDEARRILQNIASGAYNDAQIASLITVFLMRNISVEELTGFREALLDLPCRWIVRITSLLTLSERRMQKTPSTLARGLCCSAGAGYQGGETRKLWSYFGKRSQQM